MLEKKVMEAAFLAMREGLDDDSAPPATPEELTELGKRYLEKHEFKPGDLVTWKPGLKNCKLPAKGHPGVVLEVVQGRRKDGGVGTPIEFYPAEVRVGFKFYGDFEGFWLDGNRLEPYREEIMPTCREETPA